MKTAQDIILKPIITEESMMGIMVKKYTFKVAKDANKIEIAKNDDTIFLNNKAMLSTPLYIKLNLTT